MFGDKSFLGGGVDPFEQSIEFAILIEEADGAFMFVQLFQAERANGVVGIFDAGNVD